MTYAEKIAAILESGLLGRQAERHMFEQIVAALNAGATEASVPWQWKATIDARFDATVTRKKATS